LAMRNNILRLEIREDRTGNNEKRGKSKY